MITKPLMLQISVLCGLVLSTAPVIACGCNLYGQGVNDGWDEGSSAEMRGDYDTAIINYRKAEQAAKSLSDEHLRKCAMGGSLARIAGAQAGKQVIRIHGREAKALQMALSTSRKAFDKYFQANYNPALEDSCP